MPRKPTILCIDDHPDNLRIRIALLEQFGCNAIAVNDHQAALQVIAHQKVDLLIIDYHLANGRNGEEIARDVRVMRPEIPLIMLTGDVFLPRSARDCVDEVLIKGTSNPRALLDLVQKLIPDAAVRPRRAMLFKDRDKRTG